MADWVIFILAIGLDNSLQDAQLTRTHDLDQTGANTLLRCWTKEVPEVFGEDISTQRWPRSVALIVLLKGRMRRWRS
jgi:hypothetical protein